MRSHEQGLMMTDTVKSDNATDVFDHSADPHFLAYYEQHSVSAATMDRFRTVRDKSLELLGATQGRRRLAVADIGCGPGTQCQLWAELGHEVFGIDVSEPFIRLAQQRAAEAGLAIRYDVGSATRLPYADSSMDVSLLPELLEHVEDWRTCLDEAVRILKPGGLLYLSTTNALCPKQQEFNLPWYSWYPGFLKRRYERLALTTRPELANFAKYPAVHWFTFAELARYLSQRRMHCRDRFDMIDAKAGGALRRLALGLVRNVRPLRQLGYVFTPYTVVYAIKS